MSKMLPYLWYPLLFGAAIGGFAAMRANDVPLLIALYTSIVLTGLAIVVLEISDAQSSDWRPRSTEVCTDALYMLVTQIATPRLLSMLAIVLIAGLVYDPSSGPWPHQWPLAAQALLMVLAVDFMRYWLHRACHRLPLLWRLHEVHHSPDIIYILNTARFHPLESCCIFASTRCRSCCLGSRLK